MSTFKRTKWWKTNIKKVKKKPELIWLIRDLGYEIWITPHKIKQKKKSWNLRSNNLTSKDEKKNQFVNKKTKKIRKLNWANP